MMKKLVARIKALGTAEFLLLLLITGLALMAWSAGYGHDEVEHIHVTYLITRGLRPYVDFPQNHLPLFWVILIPFVKAFPFSITSFLSYRFFQILLLPYIFYCARRFLPTSTERESLFRDYALIFMLALNAIYFQWLLIRPDVLLAVFVTLALWVLASDRLRFSHLFLCGLLLGIATILSIKVYSVYFVVAIVLGYSAMRNSLKEALILTVAFAAGVSLLVGPFILWLSIANISDVFIQNVISLNREVEMTASHRIYLLMSPLVYVGFAGALYLYGNSSSSDELQKRRAIIVLFMIVGCFLTLQTGNHGDSYNYLFCVLPFTVGGAAFLLQFYKILNTRWSKIAFTVAVPFMLLLTEAPNSIFLRLRSTYVSKEHLEALISFARSPDTTCTAFAPVHPVFCEDVSRAMLGWDFIFYEKLEKGPHKTFYRKLLKEAFYKTLRKKPDIIGIFDTHNPWNYLKKEGILSARVVDRIWNLQPEEYQEVYIGKFVFWLKRSKYREFLETWQDIPDEDKLL